MVSPRVDSFIGCGESEPIALGRGKNVDILAKLIWILTYLLPVNALLVEFLVPFLNAIVGFFGLEPSQNLLIFKGNLH